MREFYLICLWATVSSICKADVLDTGLKQAIQAAMNKQFMWQKVDDHACMVGTMKFSAAVACKCTDVKKWTCMRIRAYYTEKLPKPSYWIMMRPSRRFTDLLQIALAIAAGQMKLAIAYADQVISNSKTIRG